MPDIHGNLTRDDGRTLLEGSIWLGQERGKWPVRIMQHASEVVSFLAQDAGNVAWEYHLSPVRRVRAVRPEPFLEPHEREDDDHGRP